MKNNVAYTCLIAIAALPSQAVAQQLSPTGYTGAINTPTALTLRPRTMGMSLTNSIPETREAYPGVGGIVSLNLGFGLFEGLEVVGRLTNNGDFNCNTYQPNCQTTTRDLSVGGKYKLPLELVLGSWVHTHPYFQPALALGVSDYGGAATHFRQKYVVGSVVSGPLTLSAGRSSAADNYYGGGLMHGKFASAIYQVNERLSIAVENDTRETRVALAWRQRLSGNTDANISIGKKLTYNTFQKESQFTLGLTHHFGRGDKERGSRPLSDVDWSLPSLSQDGEASSLSGAGASRSFSAGVGQRSALEGSQPSHESGTEVSVAKLETEPGGTTQAQSSEAPAQPTLGSQEVADEIASAFAKNGFSDIDVGHSPGGWVVQAEPRLWRQNRLDAYGAAIASYLEAANKVELTRAHDLSIVLTSMGQVVGAMSIEDKASALACMRQYVEGLDQCAGSQILKFHYTQNQVKDFDKVQWLIMKEHSRRFMPQFEFSPAASYVAGSEFGLFDYSIGATLGWEVPLAKGLFWQGFAARFLTESDDFKDRSSYFRRVGLGEETRPGANLLVYQQRLLPSLSNRLWGQIAVGNLGEKTSGQQFNGYWASESGRYRATWIRGQWRNPASVQVRNPDIVNLGWRPFNDNLQLTYSTGRFHNNDKGHRLAASFSLDDYGLQFYWRKTGPSDILPNKNAYAGFSITMPLGPKKALELGPSTWRMRDRWELGLETKVGQLDNFIEPFYGSFPGIRHSLDTDVFDFNRNDIGMVGSRSYRVRLTAREVYFSGSLKGGLKSNNMVSK